MIKKIITSLVNIILYPFRIVINILISLLKRLKFSIAFKISTTYLILYIIIIMTVALTTTVGYLIFELQKFEESVVTKDAANIIDSFPNLQNINTNDESYNSFEIFDENLNMLHPFLNYNSVDNVVHLQSHH